MGHIKINSTQALMMQNQEKDLGKETHGECKVAWPFSTEALLPFFQIWFLFISRRCTRECVFHLEEQYGDCPGHGIPDQLPEEVDSGADLEHMVSSPRSCQKWLRREDSLPPSTSDEYKMVMMKVSPASVSQQDEE